MAYHFNWHREGAIKVRMRLWGVDVNKQLGITTDGKTSYTGKTTSNVIVLSR